MIYSISKCSVNTGLIVCFRNVRKKYFGIFQDENRSLVERLIKYKAKDADKMNEENEHFLK